MTDVRLSENSPTGITIGATTYTGVVYTALKVQACGGGDMVKNRTVANSHSPIGQTDYPKEAILIVALDADILPALLTANYVNMIGANVALSALSITEKNVTNQVRTITFDAAKSKIQSVSEKNTTLSDQFTEVTIITYGAFTYGSWA